MCLNIISHPRDNSRARNETIQSPEGRIENLTFPTQILINFWVWSIDSGGESPTDHPDRSDSSTEPYPKLIRVKSELERTKTREVMYVQIALVHMM